MNLLKILFCLNLSLILVHEMDAIRCKEWKMFIVLKDMNENNGYKVFALAHFPLYFFILITILADTNYFNSKLSIVFDIFLIFHSIIHFLFRKNKSNELNNLFSESIIYGMLVISILHIIIL